MYDDFWLNRWALPIILSGILFYFIYFKKNWINWASKIKDEKWRNYILFMLDGLKVFLGDWKKTILLPAIIAIGLDIFIAFVFMANAGGYGETFWFAIITGGFFNPISEEFITRGILLGAFAHVAVRLPKHRNEVYCIGLVITSIIFLYGHDNPTMYQIVARFSKSLLFGLLYIVGGRNLLPPIIAHSASNLFLILLDANRGIY